MGTEHYQVAIIGAGVVGASIARHLLQSALDVALLDREADVSFGTSKGNSGIIHGGFHHKPETLKARLEIRGAELYPELHRHLGFRYRRCGIVVAAFNREEMNTAEHLYRQGLANGSPGIELVSERKMRALEPKLHPDVIGGLHAPAGGIIEPYRFVFSLVENAQSNGLSLYRNFRARRAETRSDRFVIHAEDGRRVSADFVINAAGVHADDVSAAFGAENYRITPRRGEYHLLDRSTQACPSRVVFPVPTPVSKGMLVIPTVEGTVLIGPTADEIPDKEDVSTTRERMDAIVSSAQRLIPSISPADIIRSFAGLRPTLPGDDFLIRESAVLPRFIQVAGIQSPGLTAAPAIAEYVASILHAAGLQARPRADFVSGLEPVERTREQDDSAIQASWDADTSAGQVVCRCETVAEDEIRAAITAGHDTVDGVKFYSRAGAGRCQGAFCLPRVLELISEQSGIPITAVSQRGPGSEIIADTLPGTPSGPARVHRPARNGPVPTRVDSLVVGGGAAGMAAASRVAGAGFSALIVDREPALGGVLRQCIHNGFGIHEFGEELTGPEYAERWIGLADEAGAQRLLSTTVLGITRTEGGFAVRTLSAEHGPKTIHTRSLSLAMGSRERNRGSLQIPGTRPSGILTAGAAQRMINVEGYIPGRRAVIIGSGDIGLIMARRLRLIGCEVAAVIEIQPVPSGITRNLVQCLEDFSIPLYLGHVVTEIHGQGRVSGVRVAPLDNGVPREDRAFHLDCDLLLLSVGLVPENELSRDLGVSLHRQTRGPVVNASLMTSIPGVFASGNVLHIHDLVDFVAEESARCGNAIVAYLRGEQPRPEAEILPGSNVRYIAPGRVSREGATPVYLRSLVSQLKAVVEVRSGEAVLQSFRQQHVQPSEMISIAVDGSLIPPGASVEVAIR